MNKYLFKEVGGESTWIKFLFRKVALGVNGNRQGLHRKYDKKTFQMSVEPKKFVFINVCTK